MHEYSPSATLSGNKLHNNINASGKQDTFHTTIYRADDILENPSIQLCRGGLILFALLSGGDYHVSGLKGCGRSTAHALARCGLGHKLFEAARTLPLDDLKHVFLPVWREEVRQELRTDSHGFIRRKYPSLAGSISDDFPDIDLLLSYTKPLTTDITARGRNKEEISWDKDPSPSLIAAACEQFFEWGYEEMMLHRFRKWLWSPLVCRMLRSAALRSDCEDLSFHQTRHTENLIDVPCGRGARQFINVTHADSQPGDQEHANGKLVVKIHGERTHVSTDGLLEYRLEIDPISLVRQCKQGILGTRSKPEKDEEYAQEAERDRDLAASSNPYEHLRVWMPASMVKSAEPNLVKEWEDLRKRKTVAKGGTKRIAVNSDLDDTPTFHLRSSKYLKTAKHSTVSKAGLNSVGGYEREEKTYLSEIPLPSKKCKAKPSRKPADIKDFLVTTKPLRSGTPLQVGASVLHTGTAPKSAASQVSVHDRVDFPLPKPISTTLDVILSISPQEAPMQFNSKGEPLRRQPFPPFLDPPQKSTEPLSGPSLSSWKEPSHFESPQSAFKSRPPLSPRSPRVVATHWEGSGGKIDSDGRFVVPSPLGEALKSAPSKSHPQQDERHAVDVIEILSDSDSDMPSLPFPKESLRGTEKVSGMGTSNNTCTSAGSRREIMHSQQDEQHFVDVIEIFSDSDPDMPSLPFPKESLKETENVSGIEISNNIRTSAGSQREIIDLT
jgi:hypothetical protein